MASICGGLKGLKQFDPQYLEDMSGGDDEFVRDILSTFLETAVELVNGIQAAAQDSNVERAIYVSHTLKGSARSVGALALGDLCEELERLAKSNDMPSFQRVAPNVTKVFADLNGELSLVLRPEAA